MAGEIGGGFDGMPRQSKIFFIASGTYVISAVMLSPIDSLSNLPGFFQLTQHK
jgi:hypothetical protein